MTKEGILQILKELEEAIAKLKRIQKSLSLEEFSKDAQLQDATKWNFYVATLGCLDLGNHIVAVKGLRPPESYEEVLQILTEAAVIEPALGEKLKGMAAFRNRLARGYFRIDPKRLYIYFDNLPAVETYLAKGTPQLKI